LNDLYVCRKKGRDTTTIRGKRKVSKKKKRNASHQREKRCSASNTFLRRKKVKRFFKAPRLPAVWQAALRHHSYGGEDHLHKSKLGKEKKSGRCRGLRAHRGAVLGKKTSSSDSAPNLKSKVQPHKNSRRIPCGGQEEQQRGKKKNGKDPTVLTPGGVEKGSKTNRPKSYLKTEKDHFDAEQSSHRGTGRGKAASLEVSGQTSKTNSKAVAGKRMTLDRQGAPSSRHHLEGGSGLSSPSKAGSCDRKDEIKSALLPNLK